MSEDEKETYRNGFIGGAVFMFFMLGLLASVVRSCGGHLF